MHEDVARTSGGAGPAYAAGALPSAIRSRMLRHINGLTMHVLEAGHETPGRPCLLLLHGFPELAYSWRKVMPALAAAGFHVIAPDQRGYGRTTGWDGNYDGDLFSYRFINLVRDALGVVAAMGYRSVAGVVGHDFGSPVAAWCALLRPDVFRSVVLMSAPFAGPPELPRGEQPARGDDDSLERIYLCDELAALDPPRKHYQWYYTTRDANPDILHCRQGVHNFLRAYYHVKSADWKPNRPFRLASFAAAELAKMPRYYVMDLDTGMAETVAPEMPSAAEIGACRWLPDEALRVYSTEFGRTGFQGGLQWYRCRGGRFTAELQTFSGRTIDVPALFIAGKSDWGVYQVPGAVESMQATACAQMRGVHLVEGAGHWVQQEQPEATAGLILDFLRDRAG